MRYFALLLFVFLSLSASHVSAQNAEGDSEVVFDIELVEDYIVLDLNDIPPVAPNIQKAEFLKMPPLNSLEERIDRLVQGVRIDVPPEYDHYGYEIRRYMANIGDVRAFEVGEDDYLIEKIRDVRKAKVIAEYWEKHLKKEVEEIEKQLETDMGVSFSVKTKFRQNKVIISTFLLALDEWIAANEKLLMNVFDNPGRYELIYPRILVSDPSFRISLYNDFVARQSRLRDIQRYEPFSMMVY